MTTSDGQATDLMRRTLWRDHAEAVKVVASDMLAQVFKPRRASKGWRKHVRALKADKRRAERDAVRRFVPAPLAIDPRRWR